VVGGHEIRASRFRQTAQEMHERAGVFSRNVLVGTDDLLASWEENIRPGTVIGSGPAIERLAETGAVRTAATGREAVEFIKADLLEFKKKHDLDEIVFIHVASTEPPIPLEAEHEDDAKFAKALEKSAVGPTTIPSSTLYATAAIELGCPYVNFTPSLGASIPVLERLAKAKGVPLAGKDGKTGETLMKTVLAPMFSRRNWKILSWVGHNIFGNRDGVVLDDPRHKASKVGTKDQVVSGIVGYKPQTLVSIEYIQSLDDWKTAWDHIHFEGFLGTKMILQFIWQGCDSLLAAPLVIDLARLILDAKGRGQSGIQSQFASFFKHPEGSKEHDFFRQWNILEEHVAELTAQSGAGK
jgi:myo-inositol-1-phosphate synthase